MESPYRAVVIGCGIVGSFQEDLAREGSGRWLLPFSHAGAYHTMPQTTLVGGADKGEGRRKAFAERWGLPLPKVYADYRDLLTQEKLDIVSISTPSPRHAAPAIAAIDAGAKAIFLEKPIASNLADAAKVIAACAHANIPLAINHTRRGDSSYRKARQLIDEGFIGQLQTMVAHFSGQLMYIGSHAFDTLNYFAGDCRASWMTGHLDDTPFDPGGSAYVVYENGVRAFVNGSTGHSVGFRVHAIGTDGEIIIGNYDLQLWRRNPDSRRGELILHPFPQVYPAISPMAALIQELLETTRGGPPPISSGETALEALRLVVGLHASSLDGSSPVKLSELDDKLDIPSL